MTPAASILDPNSNPALYVTRTSAKLARGVIAASLFQWLKPPSCWPASAERRAPRTCYALRKAVNRLTSPGKTVKNAHNTRFWRLPRASSGGLGVAV
jgi:hypothetical protein